MKPSAAPKVIAAVVGLILIVLAFMLSSGGDDETKASKQTRDTKTVAAKADVTISIAYSPEKDPLLVPAIKKYNGERHEVNGKVIRVEGINVASGAAYDKLRTGKLETTIWSPSSSFWGKLLTHNEDNGWIAADNPSFVKTPLVIAMWEEQAKALGYPQKQFGWSDMLAWSQDKTVFTKLNRPEWGEFKMGHTNPDFSTSGLSAVAAEYYASAGKTEGLTVADIEAPAVRAKVQALQSSVVHYGDTTLFFADQLRANGPAFASAVAMEEVTLVDFNQKQKNGPKLVAIYPKEGTFFSDNPLMTLNAPWVTDLQKLAAKDFTDYLLTPKFQATVGKIGMRPAVEGVAIDKEISAKNGADPAQPKAQMRVPEPKVLARLKELWKLDRKPADVALVFDTSGSMLEENKMADAQKGLTKFLDQVAPQDRLALVTFADEPQTLQGLTAMNPANRKDLASRIKGLVADGGTSVYDATLEGVDLIEKTGDPNHIRAVVVLTDGIDNKSSQSAQEVVDALNEDAESTGHDVRIFTIAYGSEADQTTLDEIAKAGDGKGYKGDPKTIDEVYLSISSFF